MIAFVNLIFFVITASTSTFTSSFANVIVHRMHRDHRSKNIIYPGTKWCGSGNIAENYDDLGEDRDTDYCCREHDSCPDYIEAKGTKYGLTNTASYTRLHCSCDDAFYKCLQKNVEQTNSSSSAMVGYIYFNKLDTKCYMLEHPIVGCKSYTRDTNHCEEYLLDGNSPAKWQWFDVPYFK